MPRVKVESYSAAFDKEIVALILGIQRGEFGIDVSLEDQPDLLEIPDFYLKAGGFWLAIEEAEAGPILIGTIAMIDFGAGRAAIRKMFVRRDRRGRSFGVAQRLLETAVDWCSENKIDQIYLGTISILHAARRFYEKNDFEAIEKAKLPDDFPLMAIDTNFYCRRL